MDTAREVSWHLLIRNLYKWKYKEFLLLFESANEQTPPPIKHSFCNRTWHVWITIYRPFPGELQATDIDILCRITWIYPFSTHDLLFMFFSFNPRCPWILFKLYASSPLSGKWQCISVFLNMYQGYFEETRPSNISFWSTSGLPW